MSRCAVRRRFAEVCQGEPLSVAVLLRSRIDSCFSARNRGPCALCRECDEVATVLERGPMLVGRVLPPVVTGAVVADLARAMRLELERMGTPAAVVGLYIERAVRRVVGETRGGKDS